MKQMQWQAPLESLAAVTVMTLMHMHKIPSSSSRKTKVLPDLTMLYLYLHCLLSQRLLILSLRAMWFLPLTDVTDIFMANTAGGLGFEWLRTKTAVNNVHQSNSFSSAIVSLQHIFLLLLVASLSFFFLSL